MKKLLVSILLALSAVPAFAYTECQTNINNIFYGSGVMLVFTTAGTTFQVSYTDANFPQFKTAASLAFINGTQIKVRYTANSVNCADGSTGRTDAEGLWQLGS